MIQLRHSLNNDLLFDFLLGGFVEGVVDRVYGGGDGARLRAEIRSAVDRRPENRVVKEGKRHCGCVVGLVVVPAETEVGR